MTNQWKRDWYNDNSIAKSPTVPNLGDADQKVDLRFLNAMIAHHEEGIQMAREIQTKSSRTEILNDAAMVETSLIHSLYNLKLWRSQWYNIH